MAPRSARQAGGDLLLAAPRGPVRRLLDLTGLIGVFSVYASLDQAVQTAGGFPPRGNRRVTSAGSRPVKDPRGRVSWRVAVLVRAGGFGLAGSGWWSAR